MLLIVGPGEIWTLRLRIAVYGDGDDNIIETQGS